MSCSPLRPCGETEAALGYAAPGPPEPPPAPSRIERRLGDFWSLMADLVAVTEREPAPLGGLLGTRWDVEGDPRAMLLAELWAYVADTVTAYAELTANESYLPTARDWTDLRRIAALVGYRPRPGIAAQGWVKVDVDAGTDPVVPAGTRVQAPAAPPARPKSQPFEVATTTQLRGEWAGLTATWVPQPEAPVDDQVRFLGDPGFGVGDRVLFVVEIPSPGVPVPVLKSGYGWLDFWDFLIALSFVVATPAATPRAVARVQKRTAELGTTVVRFDRDLSQLLAGAEQPYAAYRIVATAGSARRLSKVLKVPAFGTSSAPAPAALSAAGTYDTAAAITSTSVVLDAALDDLSAGQLVAVVDWASASGTPACDVVTVKAHQPVEWEVSPGTPTRVSKLVFGADVGTLTAAAGPVTVYVLDRRVVARHYTFPDTPPAPPQLRLFPAPTAVPERIAVRTDQGGAAVWEVLACRAALGQEAPSPPGLPAVPRGLIVDLVDGLPAGGLTRAPASANLVRVRHGATAAKTLGSGDAAAANQELTAPDAPIAYDLDADGTPVPSMVLRVDGVAWDEVPTLYTAGPADEAFSVRLGAGGGVTARFGDGQRGRRLPTGRNNVTASYRVGGGQAGEVPGGAIDSLIGSVRGVKKVTGAGPTAGGADQDDEGRLRALVPGRARAFGRVISQEDLVDLSVGYPGVSHAAAWHGAGPPACPCGGSGLHLVFLRESEATPRPPLAAEVHALSAFLDARRDVTVPLCVAGGVVSVLDVAAVLAVDGRRVAAAVAAAATIALTGEDGPLAPSSRALGQPLDRSDVVTVLHGVPGVLGVPSLSVGGGELPVEPSLGRQPAARYELLALPAEPDLATVTA